MNSNTVAPARALNQEKATDQVASATVATVATVANTPNLWTGEGFHQVGSPLGYGAKVERNTPGGVRGCAALPTVGDADAHR